jgi:hypothetical protein
MSVWSMAKDSIFAVNLFEIVYYVQSLMSGFVAKRRFRLIAAI